MLGGPNYVVGWQEPIYVPAPAAGDEWVHEVDGRYYERLLTARFFLNTSSAAPGRYPYLTLNDANGNEVITVSAGAAVAASSILQVYLTTHGPAYAAGSEGNTFGFLPDLIVPPGWTWGVRTDNIDVADQYDDIVLVVQRYPTDTAEVLVTG